MAAEEQRQKDVCQAQKEEEERQRMAEEQRREEASELPVFFCIFDLGDFPGATAARAAAKRS